MAIETQPRAAHLKFCIQGGRLTKYKGIVASIAPYALAPSLAFQMAFALSFGAASLMGTTAMQAQSANGCVATATPGTFECSGSHTTSQKVSVTSPDALVATTTPGFGVFSSTGNGLRILADTGTAGLSFIDQNSAQIGGGKSGLDVDNNGNGDTVVTSTGSLFGGSGRGLHALSYGYGGKMTLNLNNVSSGLNSALFVQHFDSGDLSITTTGYVVGARNGIYVHNSNFGTQSKSVSIDSQGQVIAVNAGVKLTTATNTTTTTVKAAGISANTGINVDHKGSGFLNITTTGTITTTRFTGVDYGHMASLDSVPNTSYGNGITAWNWYSPDGTTIATDEINSFGRGVAAFNQAGAVSVKTYGAVTAGLQSFSHQIYGQTYASTPRDGIYVYNAGTDLIIASTKGVSGTDDGIQANNHGTGMLQIDTAGAIVGGAEGTSAHYANGSGIAASNSETGTNLYISTLGSVSGNDKGIDAANKGTGNLSITATGTVRGGVVAIPALPAKKPAVPALAGQGLVAGTPASDKVSLSFGEGILAFNSIYGVDLSIKAADVSGYSHGISARNLGTGSTLITSTGTVIGGKSHYPNALDPAGVAPGLILLPEQPPVGLSAQGTTASFNSIGGYAANKANGIMVATGPNSTGLTIKTKAVHGGFNGILASHGGGGALSITSTGDVSASAGPLLSFAYRFGQEVLPDNKIIAAGLPTATQPQSGQADNGPDEPDLDYPSFGTGILAQNSPLGTDLKITTANVSGYGGGIIARNDGTGALTIDSSGGTVSGGAFKLFETYASLIGPGTTLPGSFNFQLPGKIGIPTDELFNEVGSLLFAPGIRAVNSKNGTGLSITTGDVDGFGHGVYADNFGSGALTIDTSGGTVTGGGGLSAVSQLLPLLGNLFPGKVQIQLDAQTAPAGFGQHVLFDQNPLPFGMLDGFAPGAGIVAFNGGSGTDLTITTADVTALGDGVVGHNFGTGALSIDTSTGDVTSGPGLLAFLPYASLLEGLPQTGTNFASISAVGGSGPNSETKDKPPTILLEPMMSMGAGINAVNGPSGTDLTVKAGKVTAFGDGIFALNNGSGVMSIDSTAGAVTGGPGAGSLMRDFYLNMLRNQQVQLKPGTTVFGGSPVLGLDKFGIDMRPGVGIRALNTGTDLTIKTAAVSSYGDGINATNLGTGALSINTLGGKVAGGPGVPLAFPTNVEIVTQQESDLQNVAAFGNTQGQNAGPDTPFGPFGPGAGIRAHNSSNGTDLNITTADVSGYSFGVLATQHGSGDLSINTTGGTVTGGLGANALPKQLVVTQAPGLVAQKSKSVCAGPNCGPIGFGQGYDGIYAMSGQSSGKVNLLTGAVTGHRHGLNAYSYGNGELLIVATGGVTGINGHGIYAGHAGTGLLSTATFGNVSGDMVGIAAAHFGEGDLRITNSGGRVTGTKAGISAMATQGEVSVSVAGDVSSDGVGIRIATPDASKGAGLFVSGSVTGGAGPAIEMEKVAGVATLTLSGSAKINGQARTATDDTDDVLSLGHTSSSGTFDLTRLGDTAGPSGIIGFDNLLVSHGSWSLSGQQSMGAFQSATFVDGSATLNNANLLLATDATARVTSAGTLAASGTSRVIGNLSSGGLVTLQNNVGGDVLNVSGNFAGGGTLGFDVDFAAKTADRFNVDGNVTGMTRVTVAGLNAGSADGTNFTLITVGGSTDAGDFVLASGSELSFGMYTYTLELDTSTSSWNLVGQGLSGTGTTYQGANKTIIDGSKSLNGIVSGLTNSRRGNGNPGTRNALTFSTKGDGGPSSVEMWARTFGARATGNRTDGALGYSFDSSVVGVQAGLRPFEHRIGGGDLSVDMFFEAKSLSGSATNVNGTGSSDGTAFGVGLAATWENDQGLYLGMLAHAARIQSEISSSNGGTLVTDHVSSTQTLMIEGGYTFGVGGGLSLTPSAGLRYTHLTGGSFTDSLGNVVDLGNNDSVVARLGATAEFDTANGSTFYAGGFVSEDLSPATTTTAGTITLDGGKDPTLFELTAGASIPIGEISELFVDGSYGHSFSNGTNRTETYSLSIGISANW